MRLGISSFTFPWTIIHSREVGRPLGVLGILERAIELGVGVVQYADNMPLHELPEADLTALRAAADRAGVSLEVGMRGFALSRLREYLLIASRLGSPILRVVTDTAGHEPTRAEIVATLSGLAPELQRAGVTLAIENHDRFGSAELGRMVDEIGSPHVGICLDTVNSLVALEDPYTVSEALARHTVNLHLKDVRARRDPTGLGVIIQGAPAGQGQVNIPWVLERIRAAGRDPNAILEHWTAPAGDPAQTMARESEWARQGIAYLRTLIPN